MYSEWGKVTEISNYEYGFSSEHMVGFSIQQHRLIALYYFDMLIKQNNYSVDASIHVIPAASIHV